MRRLHRALVALASAVTVGFTAAAFGPPDPFTQLRYAAVVAAVTLPVVYWAVGRAEARRADADGP